MIQRLAIQILDSMWWTKKSRFRTIRETACYPRKKTEEPMKLNCLVVCPCNLSETNMFCSVQNYYEIPVCPFWVDLNITQRGAKYLFKWCCFIFNFLLLIFKGRALIAKPINLTPLGKNRLASWISHPVAELPFPRQLRMSFDFNGHFWAPRGKWTGVFVKVVSEWMGKRKTRALKEKRGWFFWMCKRVESVKAMCLKCNFGDHSGSFLWYCNFDCQIHPKGCWGEVTWRRVEAFMSQVGIDAGKL